MGSLQRSVTAIVPFLLVAVTVIWRREHPELSSRESGIAARLTVELRSVGVEAAGRVEKMPGETSSAFA
jgi:hypothetical protein